MILHLHEPFPRPVGNLNFNDKLSPLLVNAHLAEILSFRLNLRHNVRGMLTSTFSVKGNTVFSSFSGGEFEGFKSTTITVSLHQQYVNNKKVIRRKIFIIQNCSNNEPILFKYEYQLHFPHNMVYSRTCPIAKCNKRSDPL